MVLGALAPLTLGIKLSNVTVPVGNTV